MMLKRIVFWQCLHFTAVRLDNKDVQDHLLEEVDNLWVPYYGPVLVPLRELRKREKVDLEDLLKMAYENLPNGVVQHIEAVGGKEMLFILDGYDEIKSHTKGAPAVVESLLEKSYLQQSSVIVTSRGIAARSLYHRVDKRFVIQGLKQGVISDFVHYYFEGSKENATQLLNKLSAAPRLAAACSNTLALAIVCYLHSKQESIPTNVTGLYGRFLVQSFECIGRADARRYPSEQVHL